uniref:Uncharacterized protein LOC104241394 n=1 Tax=Nicotiana sylvestris TaxID=4096 RepID=A0A1U7Y5W6_NICSY
MVDDRSSACMVHPRVLMQMRIEDEIIPRCITLTGFNNAVEKTSGEIVLPVLAGGVTLETTFHIMNQETAYNAIIGQPWIHAMRAVPSSFYQRPSKTPDIVEACKATIEDLDPVQLDDTNSTKKAYVGHNLSEPDMPGIPRDIATHRLNVDPLYPPERQMRRKFNAAINEAVNEEVDKLLANGSIRESKYPQWVANVVMIKKKNGKWRMCVDFTDLNKACPKDSFPLPHIDQLIDAELLRCLLRDHVPEVSHQNVQRTTRQDHGGLPRRHAGKVDKERGSHWPSEGSLRDIKAVRDEVNPEKCAFSVTSGKFLGFLMSQKGIKVNPDQIRAINAIPEILTSKKQVQKLTGRIAALS